MPMSTFKWRASPGADWVINDVTLSEPKFGHPCNLPAIFFMCLRLLTVRPHLSACAAKTLAAAPVRPHPPATLQSCVSGQVRTAPPTTPRDKEFLPSVPPSPPAHPTLVPVVIGSSHWRDERVDHNGPLRDSRSVYSVICVYESEFVGIPPIHRHHAP